LQGAKVGLDPSLISVGDFNSLKSSSKDLEIVPLEKNLIDEIWTDQPKRPANPVVVHEKHAGQACRDKIANIRKKLSEKKENWGIVVAMLDEICCETSPPGTFLARTDSCHIQGH
jgi:Xaa-Pro aminopeptidase